MAVRRFTFLFVLLLASVLLAACNLSGEPEQEITLTAAPTATPTQGSQQATLNAPPTGISVTTLPILTPGVFPTSIAYVPPTPLSVVPSVTPSTISIVILSPIPGNVVSNNVQVLGSAIHPNFLQYQLEYGPEPNPGNLWYTIGAPRQTTVLNGVLGIWSTNTIPDGLYQLRLRVYLRDGSNPQTVVNNIRVQNSAPTAIPTPTNSIPRPIAAFSVDRSVGEAPLVVRFTNRSTGSITGYGWNFGDGSSSAEANPVHVFRNAGEYEVKLQVVGPGGQSNVSQIITVNVNPPVASFTQSTNSGPSPLSVQFTDTSTGQINDYRWDFGDGTTSNERSPRHVFNAEGTYNVSLRVRGPGGTGRAFSQVTVSNPQVQPPVANFSPLNTGGNPPLSIQFTDASTGQITSRLWEFGDGATSTDANPIHQFTTSGTFTVKLTVSGPGGTSTINGQVVVNQPPEAPEASFTTSTSSGDAPLIVSFTNTTTGVTTGFRWNFGDGTAIDTSQNPTHTFTTPGTYTVTLTALGQGSTQDTATATINVTQPLAPPAADFSAQPTEGSAPLTVQFTNLSGGDQITSTWSWGDGSADEQVNDQTLSHTFQQNGTYTVTLTVSGPGGATSTKSGTITVTDRVQASFTYGALTDPPGLGLAFQDTSTGQIASWAWAFGDGTTSTDQNPTHTYGADGTYTVSLEVTGTDGVTSSASQEVTVSTPLPDAPIANFTVAVDNLRATFTNTSTGDIDSYTWDFGDGSASNEENPVHDYATGGTYNVRLVVANEGGETELTQAVSVAPPPPPAPTSSFTFDVTNLDVQFTDTSTGEITSWFWEFEDAPGSGTFNTTSTVQNPFYSFPASGTYRVRLTVANAGGSNRSGQNVEVTALPDAPVAGFTAEVDTLTVRFQDTSTGQIDSYAWDFGDGETSTERNPEHTYAQAGTFTVSLTVTNASGSHTATQGVVTTAPAPDAPTSSFSFEVSDLTATFTDTSTGQIDSWFWEFEDTPGSGTFTNTSTDQNPVYTFPAAGTYRVRLTVANAGGSDRNGRNVTVTDPLPGAPVAGFTAGVSDLTASFASTSTGQIDSYAWDFGDGATSTDQNPTHTYQNAGTYAVTLTVANAGGSNSITQQVVVTAPLPGAPVAGFAASVNDLTVSFTDTSSGEGINSWLWDFGDGTTSTEQNPVHAYAAANTYNVTLTVANAGGSNSITQQVIATAPLPGAPTSSFTFTVNDLTASFTDTSVGQVDSRLWEFEDAPGSGTFTNTSTDQNPVYTFPAAGTYRVRLTVTNAGGSDRSGQNVTVTDPLPAAPVSGFTFSVNNLQVSFFDVSSGQVDSRLWDFGDGTTSTDTNPVHDYAQAGTFTVTLTVTNLGGTNSSSQQVTTTAPLPAAPVAGFTFNVDNLNVQFTDLSSGDGINSWVWDFGDGTTSTEQSPFHSYPVANTYTVTLTVANAGGVNSTSQQVTVTAPPPAAPVANFTANVDNLNVQFTDLSSGEGIFSWQWDFGDGTTSTDQSPFHAYSVPNTYNVTLTVNNAGGPSSITLPVTVTSPLPNLPVADFTFDANELTVDFSDASSGTIDSRLWEFGDGGTSTDTNPTYTYSAPGTYPVTLTVTNSAGSSQAVYDVTVEQAPVNEDSIADTTPVMPDLNNNLLRNIFNSGGLTAASFSVIGDRSVSSGLFLVPFGDGNYELSEAGTDLEGVIQFYLNGDAGGVNAFDRVGSAVFADSGAAAFNQGDGCGDTVVACELDESNAAITIISLGYRDARNGTNPEDFRTSLQQIVDTVIDRGSIPVLLTPYTRPGEEAQIRTFAEVVIEVADANDVPVLNVWRMVNELSEGMNGNDLSVAGAGPDRIGSNQIARFGENARNYYTLDLLRRILQVVGAL